MYGEIVSEWKLEGTKLTMKVEIPDNTTATIHIPGGASGITINGSSLAQFGLNYKEMEGKVLGKTGSGKYIIVTTL